MASAKGELLTKVGASIAAHNLFADGERIVVAVSGGVDSMVLLAVLRALASAHKWKLTVAHFNHLLRGKESDADEKLVRRAARKLKIPVVVGRGSVRAEAKRRKSSIEMAARELRHQFLARTSARVKSKTIALAHHQDDQVESFFLKLLRGAGGEGLAGMKWRNPSPANAAVCLTRPLLDCAKAELREFAASHKIAFAEDATNGSLDITRNRIRHKLLPYLRSEFQPALNATILRAMDLLGADSEAVRIAAIAWTKTRQPSWDSLPVAVQRRVLQDRLLESRAPADFDWVERLRLHPDEPMDMGGGKFAVGGADGSLRIETRAAVEFLKDEKRVPLGISGSTMFAGLTFAWEVAAAPGAAFSVALNAEQFDADRVGETIILRHWRPGDRFQPIGMGWARKLQDVFTDMKTPKVERRRRVLATTSQGKIFWVQGLRVGEACKLLHSTQRRLIWRWKET